jgi:hypothetical protein
MMGHLFGILVIGGLLAMVVAVVLADTDRK